MGKHTFQLSRSGAVVYDFQSPSNGFVSGWQLGAYDANAKKVDDVISITPNGTSRAAFLDNLNTLFQTVLDGNDNYDRWQDGDPYTPVFLQFRQDGSTYTMQSEFFGGNAKELDNYISAALRSNIIPDLKLQICRRPYWEEMTAQTLVSNQSVANSGGSYTISGIRGDLPAPLTITVRTATTNQDRVIIAAKVRGTVANFTQLYEAESYTSRGSGVADLSSGTEPNFSPGSGTVGQRWTVGSTSEQTIVAWDVSSNVSDQLGAYRVFVRCRDNNSTFNVKIRVRAGIYTGANTPQYGDYGTFAKYGDGTGTSGGSNASPGTTAVPLIDCGVIYLPPVDLQGQAPSKMTIELRGQAASTSGSPTFDVDCMYLMPLYELPTKAGYGFARFPLALGNGAAPDAVFTGADRMPRAYLDSSGTIQYGNTEVRAVPMFAFPSDSQRIFVMTQRDSNIRHTYSLTNTVTISAIPRYRYPSGRGT